MIDGSKTFTNSPPQNYNTPCIKEVEEEENINSQSVTFNLSPFRGPGSSKNKKNVITSSSLQSNRRSSLDKRKERRPSAGFLAQRERFRQSQFGQKKRRTVSVNFGLMSKFCHAALPSVWCYWCGVALFVVFFCVFCFFFVPLAQSSQLLSVVTLPPPSPMRA